MAKIPRLGYECFGEFLGTWLLVFFGLATGASHVTTGAQSGLWQVAVVWGFAIALAVYMAEHISCAHFNPAVTLSFAVSRQKRFPWKKVLPYMFSQVAGAAVAAACVLLIYGNAIKRYEIINDITRGERNSTLSGMMFGIYFPNPQVVKAGNMDEDDVTVSGALIAEALSTMIVVLLVRSLTDKQNTCKPSSQQAPFYIGFMFACVVSYLAPLTQAGLNPARDFGPRLIAWFAGWGSMAMPGPKGEVFVYMIGPFVGGVLGGCLYDYIVLPSILATTDPVRKDTEDMALSNPLTKRALSLRINQTDADKDLESGEYTKMPNTPTHA